MKPMNSMFKKGFVHKLCMLIGLTLITVSVLGYLSYTGQIVLFAGNATNATTTTETTSETTTTVKTGMKSPASTTTTVKTTTTEETTTTKETTTIEETTTTVEPTDHVVFSEVFYDTPDDDSKEEWIELYNPTSDSVDLSNLTIEDNKNTYTFPNGTMISSKKFLVIARDEKTFKDMYGDTPDFSDLTLSLNNDGDSFSLYYSG